MAEEGAVRDGDVWPRVFVGVAEGLLVPWREVEKSGVNPGEGRKIMTVRSTLRDGAGGQQFLRVRLDENWSLFFLMQPRPHLRESGDARHDFENISLRIGDDC